MKYLQILPFLLITLVACKKETMLPTLSFSAEEREWFIYQAGQSIKFKNAAGDSIIYFVTSTRNYFKPEYKDPFTNPVEIGSAEFYQAELRGSAESESISICFYKEFQYGPDANKMKQTIGWHSVTGQFVELAAIKNQTPFITKLINGVTFNKVTSANPVSPTPYPWTRWLSANYDQNAGFIEMIDTGGVSWFRQ